jgi:hypothetical protein
MSITAAGIVWLSVFFHLFVFKRAISFRELDSEVRCGQTVHYRNIHISVRLNPSYLDSLLLSLSSFDICVGQFLPLLPTKSTQYVKYTYLSHVTSCIFRCLLHHLQGDHCVICSRTVHVLQCSYISHPQKNSVTTQKTLILSYAHRRYA